MNQEQLRKLFPNASHSFIAANVAVVGQAQGAEPECAVRHEPLGPDPGKAPDPGCCSIRVTSYRCRLLDPDNLCPKYFIDALRYCGVIPDDTAKDVTVATGQEKVATAAEEGTEIVLVWTKP